MTRPAHPGTIVFVDAETGTERSEPAAQVPESIAFAQVDGQAIPVVRVVAAVEGPHRTIRSYGIDGRLLSTTYQQG